MHMQINKTWRYDFARCIINLGILSSNIFINRRYLTIFNQHISNLVKFSLRINYPAAFD